MDVTVVAAVPGFSQERVVLSTDADQTVASLLERFCRAQGLTPCRDYALCDRRQHVLPRRRSLGDCGVQTNDELYLIISEQAEWACGCNIWWLLAVIFLLLVVACAVAAGLLWSGRNSAASRHTYAVGLDAGSSHTQLYIFDWPAMKLNGTGVVSQILTCPAGNESRMAPISGFTFNTSLAGASLRPCLDQAVSFFASIQAEGATAAQLEASTPVFLGATAGMRLLAWRNSSVSNEILESVRDTIGSYPFNLSQPKCRQRIIEGTEEGAFAWIATNYLLGSFGFTPMADIVFRQASQVNEKPTVGALDLGGASTQIAFASSHGSSESNSADVTRLELYGNSYEIYTHSYLCYGINEAHRKYLAFLVQSHNFSEAIDDPCAPAGNETEYGKEDIFQAPCTVALTNLDEKQTFVFHGTSNAAQCREYVRVLFNLNVTMPAVHGTFQAFSGFYYTMRFLNLTGLTRPPGLDEFVKTKDSYCNKTWPQVADISLDQGDTATMLVLACFQANYIYALLVDNYRFDKETWQNITFQNQANGADLGWILGMIVNATNVIPSVPQSTGPLTSIVVIVAFVMLAAAFVGLAIGFACCAWTKGSRSSGYTPVPDNPGDGLGSEVRGSGSEVSDNTNYGAVDYREPLTV